MKAVRIHAFGGPEVMRIDDLPEPSAGPDEVLVQVKAAGVNPVDYEIREGRFAPVSAGQLPIVLGRDVAGIATAFGEGVSDIAVDDDVYAMLPIEIGAFAEWIAAPVRLFAIKPKSLRMVEAASVPLAGLTAWQGLFDQGALRSGQKVLIHGACGGVGLFALQLARAAGAEVVATCSGADKAYVEGLGAVRAVDVETERFEDVAKDMDLVYDLVGGETQNRSWVSIKRGGALVSTVEPPDPEKARAHGVRATHYMTEPSAEQLSKIGRMIDGGDVRVILNRVYPLEEAAEAENQLQNGYQRGKIVLSVGA